MRFWKEYEDGTLAEIGLETWPFDMWRKPTPVNGDYKKHMFVDTWIASFRIEASPKSADPDFLGDVINYGSVPPRRIGISDIKLKLHGKNRDAIVLSKMMPKWTTYDEEDFYRRLHAGEIGFNNNPEFAPEDTLGLRESWSVFNAMVLEWVGDTAPCVKSRKEFVRLPNPKSVA